MNIRQQRHFIKWMQAAWIALGIIAALAFPTAAHAQDSARRLLGSFLSNGAFFFTSSSGRDAFGSVQFYNETAIYGRPLRLKNKLELSGGFEIVNVSDKLFPFTGGNQFSLFGPSFRVTTKRVLGQVRPYFSAGLFVGNLQSDRVNVNTTDFTPSLSLGVEWPFARYFTLTAGYRLTEEIGGINTDGFMVTLRIF